MMMLFPTINMRWMCINAVITVAVVELNVTWSSRLSQVTDRINSQLVASTTSPLSTTFIKVP